MKPRRELSLSLELLCGQVKTKNAAEGFSTFSYTRSITVSELLIVQWDFRLFIYSTFLEQIFWEETLIMSRPALLVFLLLILIITSQFEWRQQLVSDTDLSPRESQKQQQISNSKESVKEKVMVTLIWFFGITFNYYSLVQCFKRNRLTRSRAEELVFVPCDHCLISQKRVQDHQNIRICLCLL